MSDPAASEFESGARRQNQRQRPGARFSAIQNAGLIQRLFNPKGGVRGRGELFE
jgi:hypothetical protein